MTDESRARFCERYGRFAIVAGASEGLGQSLAEELAARGLDLLLIARNDVRLGEIAATIGAQHGVEVRTLSLDLTDADAAERILAAADGLEVGLLVYNAGAVRNADLFLDQPIELPMRMIKLNCMTPVLLAHALAPAMRQRGRGGVVLVGSTGCFVGAPRIVAYSAAKAFQVNFIEGLHAELSADGVDVLSAVIGSTSTPGRAREMGVRFDPARDMTPEDVAREIVGNIGQGPTRVIAKQDSGLGALAGPWGAFRQSALAVVGAAMKGFAARTSKG
jgi:short-subunit dehydrogenase